MEFLFTTKFIKIAFTSSVLFVLLDLLWLAVIASAWYVWIDCTSRHFAIIERGHHDGTSY
jgi:hypothetical protein